MQQTGLVTESKVPSWTKYCGKIHKIKQIWFFYGIFYSWLLQFVGTNVKIYLLHGRLSTCHRHQFQSFQEISWNFLIS